MAVIEPATESATESATAAPARYELMLPPGWTRLPVRAAQGTAAIVDLLEQRFAMVGRDRSWPLRLALQRDLTDLLADARRTGGIDLYLLTDSPGARPVDGSLLVSVITAPGPSPAPTETPVADLLGVVREDLGLLDPDRERLVEGPEIRRLHFAGDAIRWRTTRLPQPSDDLPVGDPVTKLQYAVPVPGAPAVLLLSFATTTAPVADQLVTLFDAMAGSLGFAA